MALLLKGPFKGSSTLKGFEGWVPITSLQWGAGRPVTVNPTTQPPEQAGRLTFSEITITKSLDVTTAAIAKSMQRSGPIDTVEVVEVEPDPSGAVASPTLSLKAFDVFFSGYSVSTGGERPNESISFAFTRITGTTRNLDPTNPKWSDSWTFDALK